jgi:hypothetical protein
MSSDLNWQHQDTGLTSGIAPLVQAKDNYDGELCSVARPPQALHLGDREKLSRSALLNRPPSGAHSLSNPGGKSSRTDSNFSIFSLIKRPRRSSTIVNNVEGVPSFPVSQS